MRRREALSGLFVACVAPRCFAQSAPSVRRIGWLTGGSPKSHARALAAFRDGLKEHGWVEGRNVVLELRWAEGYIERVPVLAAELVRMKPDVILTASVPLTLELRKETSTIPIVMATGADPIAAGLAVSLARPGGNVTGLTGFFEATPIKMIELASGLVPQGGRIAALFERGTMFASAQYKERMRQAGKSAGVQLDLIDVATLEDVSSVLSGLGKNPPAALVVIAGPMFFFLARELPQRTQALKVPVVYPFEESAEAGGLMSYAAPLTDSYRRAARYVDRILRGAKPGELPIEQPTRLELVVNLRAAKSQGLPIPREIVLRADRVIE